MNRLFAKLHKDLTTAPVRLIRMSILGVLIWAFARHALFWAFYGLFEVTGARPLPVETRIDFGESLLAPALAYLVVAFTFGASMLFRPLTARVATRFFSRSSSRDHCSASSAYSSGPLRSYCSHHTSSIS